MGKIAPARIGDLSNHAWVPTGGAVWFNSQLRRWATSVGANIAEGCGRRSDGEFTRFLQIARGSASELEYELLLAHDLGLITDAKNGALQERVVEVGRMLTVLVQRIQRLTRLGRAAAQTA